MLDSNEAILHQIRVDAKSAARGKAKGLSIRAFLLLAATVTGCAGHETPPQETITHELAAMNRKAASEVPDVARAARLQQAIDGLKTELVAFRDAHALLGHEIRTLNADPDASRAQFETLLESFDGNRKVLRERILARHFELLSLTTAKEWKALAGHERKALLAAEN